MAGKVTEARSLLYTFVWNTGDGMESHLAVDDVQEIWRIVRFIAAP